MRAGLRGFLFLSVFMVLMMGSVSAAFSQVVDLHSTVIDLIVRVEDFGGKSEALQIRETDVDVRLDLAADVLFEFDKAQILPQAEGVLLKAASFIKERSHGTVVIEGHTDGKGSLDYNQRLSERRAQAIEAWFRESGGLAGISFTTAGFGAKRPVVPNQKPDGSDDPEGRQKNRRVEIVIKK